MNRTMSLATADVQQVLAVAILDAKLASTPESAAGFAATLAPALTQGLNNVEAPLMTVVEAIMIRNKVAAIISSAEPTTDASAEALIIAGVIDLGALLNDVHDDGDQVFEAPTGQHQAVSSDTGMVTTVGPHD